MARRKHIAPTLAVSLKNMCFRFCCCKRSAVGATINGPASCARFQRSNGFSRSASSHRVKRKPVRSPIAALHREYTAAILAQCSPAKRRRLVGCGRLSSAVAALGFEYGLPRAKRRTMIWLTIGWQSMGSRALPSARLRLYSSRFSPPIAVFVVPHCLEFPGFPFVKLV